MEKAPLPKKLKGNFIEVTDYKSPEEMGREEFYRRWKVNYDRKLKQRKEIEDNWR